MASQSAVFASPTPRAARTCTANFKRRGVRSANTTRKGATHESAARLAFGSLISGEGLCAARQEPAARYDGRVKRGGFAVRCGIRVKHNNPGSGSSSRKPKRSSHGRDVSSTAGTGNTVMPRSVPRESLNDEGVRQGGATVAHAKDLSNYRVLVLDVSFQTIDVISWQRAICLEMFEKVDVLEYYDAFAYSAYAAYFIPAVVKVRKYVKQRGHTCSAVSLSRRNIFIRDNFTCQYCGSNENLTIDHVKPASKGGPWSWTNLATACAPCNTKKGDKPLSKCGMKLMSKPREPSVLHLSRYNRFGTFVNPPEEWRPFIREEQVRDTRNGPISLDIM